MGIKYLDKTAKVKFKNNKKDRLAKIKKIISNSNE